MSAKTKPCTCLERVQKKLADERPNTRLQVAFNMQGQVVGPLLAVEKIDPKKRAKLPTVVCAYCPICGKKMRV
jgi:tRNA(Ile2) C34 agmatinyltransferase TiaS